LRQRGRWPDHLCYSDFMQRSIEVWVSQVVGEITPAIKFWAECYPLPIGEEAVKHLYTVRGQRYPDELTGLLPFRGAEKAYWGVRVEVKRSVVDMFGLEGWTPPESEAEQRLSLGALAYALRGRDDTSLVRLVQDGVAWWHNFSVHNIQGRPRGSTAWGSPEEFKNSVREALQKLSVQQDKVTQAKVAAEMGYDVRTVRRGIKHYGGGIGWSDFLKRL
jgi:hypothetical protein